MSTLLTESVGFKFPSFAPSNNPAEVISHMPVAACEILDSRVSMSNILFAGHNTLFCFEYSNNLKLVGNNIAHLLNSKWRQPLPSREKLSRRGLLLSRGSRVTGLKGWG
eukprot:GHVU01109149.1.p2 GENE.GHVU01109149.1~~GHVU01109149.1.p2  ORF type:complete len:109 (-),score=5.23 GHVU01109149.1:1700-2026(-)